MDEHVQLLPDGGFKTTCLQCLHQFGTSSSTCAFYRQHNLAYAEQSTREFVTSAKANRQYIQDRLSKYGNVVMSRWKKKSKDKRQDIILLAQPNMYAHRWLEQRMILTDEDAGPDLRAVIAALLLPYMNVETLKEEPMRLLSLLHHRSSHKLEDWVSFDGSQMDKVFTHGGLPIYFSPYCVVMHGDDYGKLVPFDVKKCHAWITLGYPKATLILEAQDYLFNFLRRSLDLLLTPNPLQEASNEWRLLSSTGFKAPGQVECWSPFANQAYSAPPVFDPEFCLKLAETHLAAAEDHMRFLQTDPAYLQDAAQHRFNEEYISRTTSGGSFETNESTDVVWSIIANDLLVAADHRISYYKSIAEQCEYVRQVLHDEKDQITPDEPLPPRSDGAVAALHVLSHLFFEIERDYLSTMLAHSTGFAQNYEILVKAGRPDQIAVKDFGQGRGHPKDYYSRDPLHWALLELVIQRQTWWSNYISYVFGFIDHRLAADYKERKRISKSLYDHLSVMSFFHQIWANLSFRRPYPLEPLESMDLDEVKAATEPHMPQSVRDRVEVGHNEMTEDDRARLADDLRAVCEKSWPKGKRDEAWLEQADEIRGRVDKFWSDFRTIFRRVCAEADYPETLMEERLNRLGVGLSAEHDPEVEAERSAIRRRLMLKSEAKAKSEQHGKAQSQWGDDSSKKFEMPLPRAKPKTRPGQPDASTSSDAQPTEIEAYEEEDTSVKPIPVNAESLRIFAKMFPSGGEDSSKGIVKWQQVVTAMADAGFIATHGGGSAVSFDPLDKSIMGSIVFHKPHPEPEVDPIKLQNMGKRMSKWFGWERETFVEGGKSQ